MLKRLNLLLIALAAAWVSLPKAFAHPVSYKGALAVMTWNQPFLSDFWTVYSFRPDLAIAARGMRMNMNDGEDAYAYLSQVDYLVKRWNEADSQANIYVYGGFGRVRLQNQNGTAGLVGIEADAESRRLFILGRYEGMFTSVGQDLHKAEFRLGVAPYEAEYDELASWFMIAAQYHPALSRDYAITPMARFFYRSVLWETGVSTKGDWMLNLMFHF